MMSEASTKAVESAAPDLLDRLAGIQPGSSVALLRGQRPEIARYIQANYDALLEPENEAGVSRIERGLIALRVAILEESAPLVEHYRSYLAGQNAPAEIVAAAESAILDAPLSPRQKALLEHVDLLTKEPRAATPEHLARLKRQGLSDANIVTISQLIAFLSFQVRVLEGLRLLGEGV